MSCTWKPAVESFIKFMQRLWRLQVDNRWLRTHPISPNWNSRVGSPLCVCWPGTFETLSPAKYITLTLFYASKPTRCAMFEI
jgi:hypothetical protein